MRLGGLYDSKVGSASGGGDSNSDTGFAATFAAGWQAPIEGDFGFRIDCGGYMDFHQDFDEYDVVDLSISFEPQYASGQLIYSMPVAFNYAMEDDDPDYNKYSVSPTLTYLIPKTSQAISFYGIGTIIDDRDNFVFDEDGDALGVGCAYILFFENSSRIRLSLDYQHTKYDALVIDYNTLSVSTDKREDDSIVAGVDIQYQFNKFFGIYTNYSFIHSNSNVDLYEYDRNIVEAGVAFKY